MGRIHDALRRAEEERARLQGVAPPPRDLSLEARVADRMLWSRRNASDEAPTRTPLPLQPSELDAEALRHYERLHARIQFMRRQRTLRSLVIASPRSQDGRTTTALELARCAGDTPELKTCLAELDLRRPRLRHAVQGAVEFDLVNVLQATAPLHAALVPIECSRLCLLPALQAPEDASTLVASLALAQLIDTLHERFGFSIIDSPPLLESLDATELVSHCDGVLLIVRASVTTVEDLDRAVERIDASKLIGTLLTRAPATELERAPGATKARAREVDAE